MQELGYVPLCVIILANTNNHISDLNDLLINPGRSHRTVILMIQVKLVIPNSLMRVTNNLASKTKEPTLTEGTQLCKGL
jgi:hypothetical protein